MRYSGDQYQIPTVLPYIYYCTTGEAMDCVSKRQLFNPSAIILLFNYTSTQLLKSKQQNEGEKLIKLAKNKIAGSLYVGQPVQQDGRNGSKGATQPTGVWECLKGATEIEWQRCRTYLQYLTEGTVEEKWGHVTGESFRRAGLKNTCCSWGFTGEGGWVSMAEPRAWGRWPLGSLPVNDCFQGSEYFR